jgi:hypothetical protein
MSFLGLGGQVALKMLVIEEVQPSPLKRRFEAQFNPTTYKHSYRNAYQKRQGINTGGSNLKFLLSAPEVLSLTLVLQQPINDNSLIGLLKSKQSVYDRVQKFLSLAYEMNGTTHAPRMLKLSWGSLLFEGALESVDVKYTAFDHSGEPIRGELDVSFRGSLKDPMGSTAKSSPDLTHAHSVKDWQTLPMITDEIYGDPHLYLLVAEANGLDHFRALQPGQKLHFPPTEKDESES